MPHGSEPAPASGAASGPARARPPLIVWRADGEAARPLVTALEPAFALDLRDDLPDPESVLAGAAAPEMLLLYLSPAETLCRAMQAGIAPGTALEDWRARAQALRALSRRNRRRVRLVDIGQATRHRQAFRRQFGLKAGTGAKKGVETGTETGLAAPDEVLLLLAQRCLADDAQARALAGELEAASLDLGAGAGPADPDAAFRAYLDMLGARRETSLLRDQTALLRDEMAALDRARAQQAARAEALGQERDQAGEEERRARRETSLLQARNRAVQDEMEALNRARAELEQERDQAGEEERRARRETSLLREQTALLRDEMAALDQARAQLEQRLEQMSQGIESYQAQLAALQAERDGLREKAAAKEHALLSAAGMLRDLEARAAELVAQLARARAGHADTRRQLEDRRHRAAELGDRLRRMESSRSWRLTAPLRLMRAFLPGGGGA